jgi:diaminopimelate decarboxylase
LQAIGNAVSQKFQEFYNETGRKIHLEMEPWKYLVINSCSMLVEIQDIVDTWSEGYKFLKTNSGMNDMPRVAMYWVQEPLYIMNNSQEYEDYAVVGHCCESSDLITSRLYDAEVIEPRKLKKASIWDILVIDGVWAYNSGMAIKNYNSFPETWELLLRENWKVVEIRKRQETEDIWKNEDMVI